MTDKEAMQQALAALDLVMSHGSAVQEAKNILQERLAQPEQEPVKMNDGRITRYPDGSIGIGTPPQRKPEQEMCDVLRLAQDALQMACTPFPVDEIKTIKALQAVNKLLQEMEQT